MLKLALDTQVIRLFLHTLILNSKRIFLSSCFVRDPHSQLKISLLSRGNKKLHTQAVFLFASSDLGFDSWFLLGCIVKLASLAGSTPCLGSWSLCSHCSSLLCRMGRGACQCWGGSACCSLLPPQLAAVSPPRQSSADECLCSTQWYRSANGPRLPARTDVLLPVSQGAAVEGHSCGMIFGSS